MWVKSRHSDTILFLLCALALHSSGGRNAENTPRDPREIDSAIPQILARNVRECQKPRSRSPGFSRRCINISVSPCAVLPDRNRDVSGYLKICPRAPTAECGIEEIDREKCVCAFVELQRTTQQNLYKSSYLCFHCISAHGKMTRYSEAIRR